MKYSSVELYLSPLSKKAQGRCQMCEDHLVYSDGPCLDRTSPDRVFIRTSVLARESDTHMSQQNLMCWIDKNVRYVRFVMLRIHPLCAVRNVFGRAVVLVYRKHPTSLLQVIAMQGMILVQ